MISDDHIYIRWCLLKSRSFYRALHPHRQDHPEYSNRDVYPPTIDRSIDLIIIGIIPDPDSTDGKGLRW
jgi:hypothetical protein